ncbi:hypothetical protein HOLleu_31569 [Holothuria leucospilota]|uniref:Uncharacterized protein n=1 Tax=Holothuria leucospilota TaxID=206669 RepID=A0A9Q0YRX5_HOLLE|nr:hypothetical protein HOLleu_31569 [Holothuria leucospilota]
MLCMHRYRGRNLIFLLLFHGTALLPKLLFRIRFYCSGAQYLGIRPVRAHVHTAKCKLLSTVFE